MPETQDLKACECGGSAWPHCSITKWQVICNECFSAGPKVPSKADAIAAWNHRVPPAESGWLPIESAPKDGTVIDLWFEGKRLPNCYWSFGTDAKGNRKDDPVWDGWCCDVGKPPPNSWNPYPNYVDVLKKPTHWSPIPKEPTQ